MSPLSPLKAIRAKTRRRRLTGLSVGLIRDAGVVDVNAKKCAGDRGLLGLSERLRTAQKYCKQDEGNTTRPRVNTFFMVFSLWILGSRLGSRSPSVDFHGLSARNHPTR